MVIAAAALSFFARAGDDDLDSVKGLTLSAGIKAQLWSSPKQIINPVSICFDDQNRMYVAQTYRFRIGGGIDIREAKFMLADDARSLTTADRLALYDKYKGKFAAEYFTKFKEKIFILEDSANKGKADKVTSFAEAFNEPLDGPGVGIAYHDGKIYYSCIPKIWELSIASGESAAATKIAPMFDGFGVRVGISGHDLHGLVVGPDGKLYWSLGDRGYSTVSREGKKLDDPFAGAVFRCNFDGSDLEVYFYGLRNPQELAFDENGNLFTVDNNSDQGDKSRLTYILEGGSSGWSSGCQLLTYSDFAKLAGLPGHMPNPWLQEGLWKERHEGQPAWILPTAGHITSGPCGLTYNPGKSLPEAYARNFFVTDYTAGTASCVHAFTADEDGAGFVLKNARKMVSGINATDVDFGHDGKMYICDYGGGWSLSGKGRIITVTPDAPMAPEYEEMRKLFASGFAKLDIAKLTELLKHSDMRTRMNAQFELAKRGKEGAAVFVSTAKTPGHTLARLHAIWGLGQVGRTDPEALKNLVALLKDDESRVREQAAKTLSDAKYAQSADAMLPLLKDKNLRVRTLSAIALGKFKHKPAFASLIEMLKENDDKDAFVRHGAIMGLAGIGDVEALKPLMTDASKAVRLGVLLTLRRLKDPAIAAYLKDADAFIRDEAMRAIYDVPIIGAMPSLAAELKAISTFETAVQSKITPLMYGRIVNANYRYGSADAASAIAQFITLPGVPESVRAMALDLLMKWEEPSVIDPVVGVFRPVPKRAKLAPNDAIKTAIKSLMEKGEGGISAKALDAAMLFEVELNDDILLAIMNDAKKDEALRVNAMSELSKKKSPQLQPLLPKLLAEGSMKLRIAALDAQLALDPPSGLTTSKELLSETSKLTGDLQVLTDKSMSAWTDLKMGAPSSGDYADKKSGKGVFFRYVKGFTVPNEKCGADGEKLPRLNDGEAAMNNDDLERNVWFDGKESRVVADLQKAIEVGAVNTYSWHSSNRAPQVFTLWGAASDAMPSAAANLDKEWVKIASVNTDPLKNDGMHGSSVFKPGGSVGKFRWLLWQNTKNGGGTFFSEMDVYEAGTWNYADPSRRRMQQQVMMALGRATTPLAGEVIFEWLNLLSAGKVPAELHLDLIEAAGMRSEEKIKKKIADFKSQFPEDNKVAPFKISLAGGDSKCGEELFKFHAASCIRCHKIANVGGDAGPDLAGVGKRLTREQILESLITPNSVVVPGYGQVTLKLEDGNLLVGSIVEENAEKITIKDANAKVTTVPPGHVKKRLPPVSPMPPMDTVLKAREVRDLIEYLSTLK